MSNDPWRHRSTGMKCSTCMWFVTKAAPNVASVVGASGGVSGGGALPDGRGVLGRCRRHAPTMNGYPAVFASDWCGDHKLDEAKL